MSRTLKDISHLFLSESSVLDFPPSPPSAEPTFDPERIFAADQFFPNRGEWEQILQWHRLCRALVAGLRVHLSSPGGEAGFADAAASCDFHPPGLLEHIAKGPEGRMEAVDFQAAVQSAALGLKKEFACRHTRYVETIPERMPRVRGVSALLIELVERLLGNSLEATRGVAREREVFLTLEFTPQEMYLTVGDNGEGLTSETLARMFFPFFTTWGGSGLGLFWVCQILELHRGQMKLWSQPSIGTEVYLRIPIDG